MSHFISHGSDGAVNLQATLSAGSASTNPMDWENPHHPITCSYNNEGLLLLHEDNSMECRHGRTKPDNPRTQMCINHSIALLLMELVYERENPPERKSESKRKQAQPELEKVDASHG